MNLTTRDKSILVGLYLSRFDQEALNELGFEGTLEASNVLGYAIGAMPRSIRNYRDEFDPYFPNPRKGWHGRPLREHCKKYLDAFSSLDFKAFTDWIKSFLIADYDLDKLARETGQTEVNNKKDLSASIEKRLLTGIAAEEYFKINYQLVDAFTGLSLMDTTKKACGFDFKLDTDNDFYCIEVKGLNLRGGNVSLTEKEYEVAKNLKEKYCLFVVSNFIEKPMHTYYFDPLGSRLSFTKNERTVVQRTYTTKV